jgi:hypothetical protein
MSNNQDLHDERISRLYKLGDQREPPEHLDRVIKQAAQATAPRKKRSYAWPSLATAAVLVLSISLVLKVLQQDPLEKSIMDPSSINGGDVSPEIMLQEREEKDAEVKNQITPKLQRYRAVKQKAAPAPAESETVGTTQQDMAPIMADELQPIGIKPHACSSIKLPDTDSSKEWIKQYQKAVELGQIEMARCLQQAYRLRFNRAMPANSE